TRRRATRPGSRTLHLDRSRTRDTDGPAAMDGRHLSRLLEEAAAARPDRVAVEDGRGGALTYAELRLAAGRVAARLARWGVERGDRVGLWLPKGVEAVAAIHGVLRA